MGDVRQWLDALGLGQYAGAFEENDVDLEVLGELTDEDLKGLGLSLGHRRKLQKALRGDSPPGVSARASTPTDDVLEAKGEAERRQLTVVFADLAGSTELSRKLDPEDLREINQLYQDAAKAAIEQCGGYVARYMGDGVLAYFGYPQAHEDDAERALRAGLALCEAVPELSPDVALAVRVGIATGSVVVGDLIGQGASRESAVVGETPNLAARLQGEAAQNTVVIAESTRALVAGLFEVEALPPGVLKGFPDPVSRYRVRAEKRGQPRFAARSGPHLSRFVGREEELEALRRRWSRAKAGEGQVVLTLGEAGIGKSRLVEELRACTGEETREFLTLQCSPYHENSPLYPVIAAFERLLGFAETREPETRLDALRRHLDAVGETDELGLGLMADLLSVRAEARFPSVEAMDPAQRRERILRALVAYLVARAATAPVLCAFEDVHWADPTTLELLGRLGEAVPAQPVLIIATARPGFVAAWTDLPHVHVLTLSRLGSEAATELVVDIADATRPLPGEVVRTVLSRAEGNPLFIEELTRTLLRSGEPSAATPVIPATLQDSLMARLDASPAGKAVAQCAAVLGRAFPRALLSMAWSGSPDQLEMGLSELERSGLVSRHGEGEAVRYVFKHALVQDAAYGSLLRADRSRYHARVAAALEAESPELLQSRPELLARHYTEAGNPERAVTLWLAAAQRANERSAGEEAIAHVGVALPLLGRVAESGSRMVWEADLQLARAKAERGLRRSAAQEMNDAYERVRDLSEALGDAGRLLMALEGCGRYRLMRGNHLDLRRIAARMMEVAEEADDQGMRALAEEMSGISNLMTGRLPAAREHYEHALAAFGRADPQALKTIRGNSVDIYTLRGLAFVYSTLGYLDRGLAFAEQGMNRARSLDNPFYLCEAYWGLLSVLFKRLDHERLLGESRALVEIARDERLGFQEAFGRIYLGTALGALGDLEEGIQEITEARSTFESLQDSVGLHNVRVTPFAVYLARAGREEEALRVATEAVAESKSQPVGQALASVRLGEVLRLTGGSSDEAERCFLIAVDGTRAMQAKAWELEASHRLAELWSDRGERERAATLLASICASLTEGHDAPSVRAARAFLERLR